MLTLAAALRDAGSDVALVGFPGGLADAWEARVGVAPILATPGSGSQFSDVTAVWRRYLRARRNGDSVVIFTYYLVLAAPAVRLLTIGHGTRLALDMHDVLPRRRAKLLLRVLSSACHSVVSVSRFTAEQFGGRRRGAHVITRPVDPSRIVSAGPNPRTPARVGIVGRLVEEKGHDVVIAALAPLRSTTELIVRGGADPSRPHEAKAILSLGRSSLGEAFIAEGSVPVENAFSDLDVLVIANPTEPMGRTALEAQLAGVVVVVPDTGGSAELVDHGRTGFHYRAGDAAALTDAIRQALDTERAPLLARARAAATATTDPAVYARSYTQAISRSAR